MGTAYQLAFVIAVNTSAGCYGIHETRKGAIKNCNKERSWMHPKTQPTVFYYISGCRRDEVMIECGVGLSINWPKGATAIREEIK